MAAGGWVAGLLYDHLGYYAPAFAVGIGANILNLLDRQRAGRTKTPTGGLGARITAPSA